MTTRARRHFTSKNRRKNRNILLLVIFLAVLVITSLIAIAAYVSTNVYQNKEEFRQYADEELKKTQNFSVTDKTKVEYEYASPISYVVEYDACDDRNVAAFREQRISEIKQKYIETASAVEKARKKEKKRLYRPLEHALILKSSVYRSVSGAISLAIYEDSSSEVEKDMKRADSRINTYQFSAKTGNPLEPMQIFRENYRQICSKYFSEYFRRNYGKDELKKGWEQYVTAEEGNFSKYALTDEGVTFYFDEGTVLKKSRGVVQAGISVSDLEGTLRESVLERYIDPSKPMVAVTYDDGPGGNAETRILECLKKHGAVATFFYLGNRVYGSPQNVKTAYEIGCELGNHTWNHPVLTSLKPEELTRQFNDTNAVIKDVAGVYPTLFRPSYGETNDAINKMSDLPVVMWTVDTLDWKYRDGQKIFDAVRSASNLDGKIILMHSIYESTADATDKIIPWLKENGYQTVTVSELIKYKTGADPQAGNIYHTF